MSNTTYHNVPGGLHHDIQWGTHVGLVQVRNDTAHQRMRRSCIAFDWMTRKQNSCGTSLKWEMIKLPAILHLIHFMVTRLLVLPCKWFLLQNSLNLKPISLTKLMLGMFVLICIPQSSWWFRILYSTTFIILTFGTIFFAETLDLSSAHATGLSHPSRKVSVNSDVVNKNLPHSRDSSSQFFPEQSRWPSHCACAGSHVPS